MDKIRVFLAEDEFVVRQGIKKNIDWEGHRYEFCGEAADGELAFPMIQKLRPEIVITDIRMPFMDGLELSRLIKKELPHTEIIILTGHEEFEYAKECIQIGVAEYMLKPVSGEELLEKVDALSAKIRERRKEEELRETYLREMDDRFLQEKKGLFQNLVSGGTSTPELLEAAKRLEVDLSALYYNIVLIKLQPKEHSHEAYSDSIVRLEEQIEGMADEEHIVIFDRNLEGKAVLFEADSLEELGQIQNHFLEEMVGGVQKYDDIRYFGGIGRPVNRLSELPVSYEEAGHAFAHRYLLRESMILDSSNMDRPLSRMEENLDIPDVDPKQIDREKLQSFLRFGEAEESLYFVEEYCRELSGSAMQSVLFRQYIAMDAYFAAVDFLEGLGISKDRLQELQMDMKVLESEKGMQQYLIGLLQKTFALRDNVKTSRYKDVIGKVVLYVEEHYGDEELSLNSIASFVNFSPNHLSTIFSQEYGQTFIKYLTDYRMNKAKELLRDTSKKSSEICQEVGYRDPHYFSFLFKKTQGMTPTQYRGGRPQEGDEL